MPGLHLAQHPAQNSMGLKVHCCFWAERVPPQSKGSQSLSKTTRQAASVTRQPCPEPKRGDQNRFGDVSQAQPRVQCLPGKSAVMTDVPSNMFAILSSWGVALVASCELYFGCGPPTSECSNPTSTHQSSSCLPGYHYLQYVQLAEVRLKQHSYAF